MINDNYAIVYDKKANKIIIFKYQGDFITDIDFTRKDIIRVKSCNAQKEIEFYQFYYDIPDENVLII